jgi:hypothetical protein
MTPIEAFRRAFFYVSGLCSSRTENRPGAVIERLSPEAREALSQLKSEDIGPEVRLSSYEQLTGTEEYYRDREFKKDRLDFDKKILK